jgi:hypothetical protein
MKCLNNLVLIGLLANFGPTSAATFLIDDFTRAQGPIVTVENSVRVYSGFITSLTESWSGRALSVQHYGDVVANGVATASIDSGSFKIATNQNLYSGTDITWQLPQIQGLNGATNATLDFKFDSLNLNPIGTPAFGISFIKTTGSFYLPFVFPSSSASPSVISFSLSNAQLLDVTAGGSLFANFYGVGLNLALDSVSLSTDSPVSPVPEPSEWAMLLGGLSAIAALTRRRKSLERSC